MSAPAVDPGTASTDPGTASTAGRHHPITTAFDRATLAMSRRAITASARLGGLSSSEIDQFVLAANEILTNAILHGGGGGILRIWHERNTLRCRITDTGPGIGTVHPGLPDAGAAGGRGLWLANQCCTVEITSGPKGTTVDLSAEAATATLPTPRSASV